MSNLVRSYYASINQEICNLFRNKYFNESDLLRYLEKTITDEDKIRLQQMSYNDYLNTLYWYIIRNYCKSKNNYTCEKCNRTGKIHIHHKNYDYLSCEYEHWDSLQCLCDGCHLSEHIKYEEYKNLLELLTNAKSLHIKLPQPIYNENYDSLAMIQLKRMNNEMV